MSDFKWFLLALLGLWILWAGTGGYSERTDNKDKPFLEQPAPIESGRPYTFDELKNRNR